MSRLQEVREIEAAVWDLANDGHASEDEVFDALIERLEKLGLTFGHGLGTHTAKNGHADERT